MKSPHRRRDSILLFPSDKIILHRDIQRTDTTYNSEEIVTNYCTTIHDCMCLAFHMSEHDESFEDGRENDAVSDGRSQSPSVSGNGSDGSEDGGGTGSPRETEKDMRRMYMDFSRVKIVRSEAIAAVKAITAEDVYTLARLQKQSLKYTVDEDNNSVDDIASALNPMLYGDLLGNLVPEGCMCLEMAGHVAAALIIVLEAETNAPRISFAMTHRLHKRNGCMGLLMRLAFSKLKMLGYNSCAVVLNVNNEPVRKYFENFGFSLANETDI